MEHQIEGKFSFDLAIDRDDCKQYVLTNSGLAELNDEIHIINDLDGTFKITFKINFQKTEEKKRENMFEYMDEKSKKARKDMAGYLIKNDKHEEGKKMGEIYTGSVVLKWGDEYGE